jgi:cytochrome c-type biogenesis protein CcmH
MAAPFDTIAFVIACALAAAVLAFAISRLVARGGTTHAQAGDAEAPRHRTRTAIILAAAAGMLAMGLGFFTFFSEGTPSDSITAESGADLSRAGLVRRLEHRPNDGRAWVLLARTDFEADRFSEAATEYERALNSGAKVAGDPAIWCEYADALGMAQGGSLAGRPREIVMQVLIKHPKHPKALEMAGSAAFEAHEYTAAVQFWRELLPQLAGDPQAQRALTAAIAHAEQLTDGAIAQSGATPAGK